MKTSLLALLLVFAAPFAGAATATTESVEALLELTKAKELVDGANTNIEGFIRQGMLTKLGNAKLTPEQSKVVELNRPGFHGGQLV